ncbi:MAG: aldehyde dehydrogenase family protein, partial [Ruthenibacterium sp.]
MMNPLDYVQKTPYMLYIDGKYVPSLSKKTSDAVNPATGEVFAQTYRGGKEDCELAIAAARKAYDEGPWGKMSAKDRSKLLLNAARILERRAEEFAVLETLECGKNYGACRYWEAPMAVDAFEYFAGKARCLEGKVVPCETGTLNYVTWNPCGVVGEILPWNGPFLMGCQKVNAILAAGNTVVIKPPSWGQLSMLLMAGVYEEAGFPAGVVNVVTGSGSEVGNCLVESSLVDMVSMTGGTETGRSIIRHSAPLIKDIALELGGKSPNIIFGDVDVEQAARWAVYGFTNHSGQICVSGTRVLVERTIYHEFLDAMQRAAARLVPGDGFDPKTTLNTLVSAEHAKTVWNYIETGKKEGARLVCGGEPYTDPALVKGCFVPPTIFADVTADMTIFQQKIFGPVG